MGISLELEAKEAPPAPIPNPLLGPENQKLLRKRSSCPNLKMYVKDQHGQVTGIDVDLSPPIGVDVEASFIEEKCCFLVPSGFMSGKKGARRSSAEIAFKMHSIRWNRSRCYIRLGLLLLILIFSVPYAVSTLYCYLKPIPMPPPKNDSLARLNSISHLWNRSEKYTWEEILREASVIPKSESEVPKIKCYEDFKDVEGIMEWSRFWIEGIILSVVGCIGIMGNLISLHILRKDSMRKTSFDEMLTHLLILDTIMVIFFLLDFMTTNVFEQTPEWYKILYPYVIHPGKAIFVSATVFMVVAVSADRQRAICHSMLYRPSPTCICIVILAAATLSNLPRFFEFYLIYDHKIENYDFWTTELNEDPRYIRWSSYNELITSGIFPLLALCYYNYEIYARIRMSCFIELGRYVGGGTLNNPPQNGYPMMPLLPTVAAATGPKSRRETEENRVEAVEVEEERGESPNGPAAPSAKPFQLKKEKSTAILLAIIVVFLACHLLRFIVQVYEVVSSPLHGGQKLFEHCQNMGKLHVPAFLVICGNVNHLLLVVNSSVNMIIYVCLGRRFRNHLRHIAAAHCGQPPTHLNGGSGTTTNTTSTRVSTSTIQRRSLYRYSTSVRFTSRMSTYNN